ncbi:Alpha/Beta hydrolase protein [Xylogone sp. PMI_703]|nr:Alpha/Beta hydrolase protein [Xylogone sp. PMI_703]
MASMATSTITTSDNVTLRYIDSGLKSGPVLVLIPGWCQSAIQFKKQIAYFGTTYRVISMDHRGHGDSDKPDRGYRIPRLAADLHELITQLDLKDLTLLGHSMGCSVIWSYWDTYVESRTRISKLVLVDQSVCMIANPTWEEGVATSLAAIFTPANVLEIGAGMCGPEGKQVTTGLITSMFTPSVDPKDLEWTLSRCFKVSPKHAATLLANHAAQDWRDVLPTINVPSLVIGAEGSLLNKEGTEYIAAHIPGAKLEIFKKEEGGSHFMYWENDKKFNQIVEEFLQS